MWYDNPWFWPLVTRSSYDCTTSKDLNFALINVYNIEISSLMFVQVFPHSATTLLPSSPSKQNSKITDRWFSLFNNFVTTHDNSRWSSVTINVRHTYLVLYPTVCMYPYQVRYNHSYYPTCPSTRAYVQYCTCTVQRDILTDNHQFHPFSKSHPLIRSINRTISTKTSIFYYVFDLISLQPQHQQKHFFTASKFHHLFFSHQLPTVSTNHFLRESVCTYGANHFFVVRQSLCSFKLNFFATWRFRAPI